MAGTNRPQTEDLSPGPIIVLVDPQMGENIGASARAMLNCRLTDLRIVRPRDGWPNPKAVASASGADVVLDNAVLFTRVEDAVADCHRVFATTARPRHLVKPVLTPRAAAAEMRAEMAADQRVAILFGSERKGLDNDDLVLADTIITAPLNPGFSSLNLAQAVLLVAMEWATATASVPDRQLDPGTEGRAEMADLFRLFDHWELALDRSGFFRTAEQRPTIVRNLRTMLQRTDLTAQEVRTLHGMITAMSGVRADGKARFGDDPLSQ